MTIRDTFSDLRVLWHVSLGDRRGSRRRPRSDQGRVRRNQAHHRHAPAHGGRRPGSAAPRTPARSRCACGSDSKPARRGTPRCWSRARPSCRSRTTTTGSGRTGNAALSGGRRSGEPTRSTASSSPTPACRAPRSRSAASASLLDDQRFVGNVGLAAERADLRRLARGEPAASRTWCSTPPTSTASIASSARIRRRALQGRQLPAERRLPDQDRQDHARSAIYSTSRPITSVPAGVNPIRDSTSTYGLRFAGEQAGGQDQARLTRLRTPRRPTTRDNPLDFDLDYRLAELTATFRQFGLGVGHGDHGRQLACGKGFTTPLATLHKFQGWADKFLTTPAERHRGSVRECQRQPQGRGRARYARLHRELSRLRRRAHLGRLRQRVERRRSPRNTSVST